MAAVSLFIQKSFEVWPGKLNLAASGEGACDAVDAGMDAARDLSLSLLADAELLSAGTENPLPRGRAGRLAVEAMSVFRDLLPVAAMPPSLTAVPGAVCDAVLAAMLGAGSGKGGVEVALVSLGDVAAIHQEPGAILVQDASMPPVLAEFLNALGSDVRGGVAMGGIRSGIPTRGLLDSVTVQSKSAAIAGLAAATIADAAIGAVVDSGWKPRDRLLELAWRNRPVSAATGFVEPEQVWEALSSSVRCAMAIREKRLLRAAALGLKGRGRTIGPIDGDRLLRFGVSEWR
ncbi:hypothetical protein Plav_2525 [Parvibaculum lavamentivorans DS-1]|uniref:ApbE family lipoprotein n=1 Tax=Parvibaculum lavamentivorans (strain DS-1 / DSM 13023 / NCIMB 13966) TaxID=402881 RepID=A7HW51_PARL1|nr:hypothetical protein [Parvibaculum lavamentivorans]ABS64134.1 hypothetical protein Plav_2525 [Parvibaculum lavamentivorans DS-1]